MLFWLYLTLSLGFSIAEQSDDCYDILETPPDRQLIVHLFEWKWEDIALECENYLQYTGIGAVQVSPPNEHLVLEFDNDYPWWLRYQPVSYQLESRSGNAEQFSDMVNRCHKVGIKIIVDAVINHMTNMQAGSSGCSTYDSTPFKENFSSVPYYSEDFNDGICDHNIENYFDPWQVRNCRLSGLLDLNLSKVSVQQSISAYLNHLLDLGVAGFRIDAAKHIYPQQIKGILKNVKHLNPEYYPSGKCPLIFNEVIDQGSEPIKGSEYTSLGRITNFRYGLDLAATMNRLNDFKYLYNFGEAWDYWKDHDVVVFVDNHDNQRGSGGGGRVQTYKDGHRYVLAVSFMLAWPYGIPRLMSSYYFETHDEGPPSSGKPGYRTKSPEFNSDNLCTVSSGWVCEHRWPGIRRMTLFHKSVAGALVANISTEDHRIAFSRGDRGFFALNNNPMHSWVSSVATGLKPGLFCDLASGEVVNGSCTGKVLLIKQDGTTDIFLKPEDVAAVTIETRLPLPDYYKRTVVFVRKEASFGEQVFLRGGISHDRRKDCDFTLNNNPCTIPIVHIGTGSTDFNEWKKQDNYLDWYGAEENQGRFKNITAQGSPLIWTSNRIDNNKESFHPFNIYGEHYWVFDVMMDCSKTDGGWFELKAVAQNRFEEDIEQKNCVQGTEVLQLPWRSKNHIALCGFVNVFQFNKHSCYVVAV